MLGPTDGVAEGGRLLSPRVLADSLGHFQERLFGGAADLLDHLRRVFGEVPLEDLEDATLVLERRVGRARLLPVRRGLPTHALADQAFLTPPDGGVVYGRALVAPARRVVLPALPVPAGKVARDVSFLELFGYEGRGVGVVDDVVFEVPLVLDDVVDQTPQKRYVRARTYGGIDVAERRGAREARVDVDERSSLVFGDHGVPKAYGVGFGHVGAFDQDAVGILQVLQGGGGPAPTVRDAQTGHRGAVSYPCLVSDPQEPQRVEELGYEVILFVVYGGPADGGDRRRTAELLASLVPVLPVLVARLLDSRGDHVGRLLEREILPLRRVRPAVADLRPAVRRDVQTEGGRALGTERARVYGAVGVPFDVQDAPVPMVDERRAAYRAVGTHAHGFLYTLIGDARADGAGRRAYRVLDRRADVVPDLLPETVFLRELEEHARPLLCQRCDCPGFLPDSNLIHPVTKPRPKSYVQMCRPPVYVVSFLHRYATSGTLRGVSFGGKELAWISEMRPHAGRGKFGGAVERENKLLLLIVSGKRERRGFS